ncbi:alpha/beta hydrolase [Ectothiorhodospiraceae bacterium WFHF3C12]|nr:alpha/beta hydrolase [Ectothiorhodospiraceae bacterium WFHF3C12]
MNLSDPKPIDVERGHFTYREGGDPNGKPVVMIHGWPESSYCWEHVTGYLKPGLRVIAPDLRGLGDSERTEGLEHYRKAELAKDVIQMLDALGIGEFQLIGHDWGGIVAQEVALAVPERVTRMIIMNIAIINNLKGNQEVIEKVRQSGSPHYWYQHFQQAPGLAEAMIPGSEEAWLGYFLRSWNKGGFPEDAFREYVRFYQIPGTPGAGANYYRAFRDDARRWATLGGHVWPMPSLYIYGNKDVVIIPEYLNRIEECFEDIRVEQVEAGHFLQEERPEEVAGHMNGFLEN